MHIKVSSSTLKRNVKMLQRSVVCGFLEFAEVLSGKFIIRMDLWDPEDVQGSAQSETRVEFSLDLPYSPYLELSFL